MPLFGDRFGGTPIIDDNNYTQVLPDDQDLLDGKVRLRGWKPRDFTTHPLGGLAGVSRLPIDIIPRSEWKARIDDRRRRKMGLRAVAKRKGVTVCNQQETNFCWFNCVTYGLRILRAKMGMDDVKLSSAFGACQINNFANQGGWPTEAVQFVQQKGICPESMWPNAAISRSYLTPEAKQAALDFRLDEVWDLAPRSFDELATCLLLDLPCPIGLNWWGHAICCLELDYTVDGFIVLIANSWGDDWEDEGFAYLTERKATPDGGMCLRSCYQTAA